MKPIIGNRTERKKEETRKRIIAVAMELFIKQGFEQTTVEQIAEEADLAKGTIYNHFPVKEAILCEYVQRRIKEQGPLALNELKQLPDTRSRLIAALHKTLEWMQVQLNNDIYEKYFIYRMQTIVQSIEDKRRRSGVSHILEQIVELGKETGEIRQDVPTKVLAGYLETISSFTAIGWVTRPECFSIYEAIDMNVDIFLSGARKEDNQK
ncbi:TetR/AcrR family transcriptional regulator [Desulforamulus ruminis]|uniref:Regulatory protein TetR n=1 Tax=Desulforamulus ruminis (strain ATCC 23193 / DSM 2154 / NCIMB 8452 / DL) TaxID=696281 RepID=F6DK87_DESRL|nr:TetR/AcrR family transcriptional regulator [Desulforamulus ruminis]AEG61504.1 regulatory protein TetR [Desulforamulus ruminis DSM 2154]